MVEPAGVWHRADLEHRPRRAARAEDPVPRHLHRVTSRPMARVMERGPLAERGRARIPRRIWSPPGHWRLLTFCAFVVLVVLAFEGISAHTIGASSESHDLSGAPAPLARARPLL